MFVRLHAWILQYATLRNIFLAVLVQTLLQFLMVLRLEPEIAKLTQLPVPDLRFFYSSGDLRNFIEIIGDQGRYFYKIHLVVDLVYPFAYGSSLLLLAVFLGSRGGISYKLMQCFIAAPLLLMAMDMCENISLFFIVQHFPEPNFLESIAGWFTMSKQILLAGNLIGIGLLGLYVSYIKLVK